MLEDVKTISKLHNKTLQRPVERGTWERKQDIKIKNLRPEEKGTESKGDDPMARMVLGLFWGHTKMLGLTSASQSSGHLHSQDMATINVLVCSSLQYKQNMPSRYLSDMFLRKESEHTWKRGPNKQTKNPKTKPKKPNKHTEEVLWLFLRPWKSPDAQKLEEVCFLSSELVKIREQVLCAFFPCLERSLSGWIYILKIRSFKSYLENRTMQMNCGCVFWWGDQAFTQKVLFVKRSSVSPLGKKVITVWCW